MLLLGTSSHTEGRLHRLKGSSSFRDIDTFEINNQPNVCHDEIQLRQINMYEPGYTQKVILFRASGNPFGKMYVRLIHYR